MTDDLDRGLRDRLRRTELPPAPDRLRARVNAVAANPTDDTAAERDRRRNGRLLLPLAAVLLIGAVAISTGGGGPRPGDTSGPRATPAGPVHAELIVNARELEWPCSPGGCEVHITLELPSGPWTGKLTYADLGALRRIEPPLPPLLSDGTYRLRADIHVIGDVIEPGENAPPDYGVAGSCATEFTIEPDTTVAVVTLDLRATTCTAGTVVAADPAILPTFEVFSQFDEACGADVGGCDYSLTLTGATGTWYALTRTVRPPSQRLINELVSMLTPGAYRLEAESHRMGVEREFGAGFQEDLETVATCAEEFVMPADAGVVVTATVAFRGAACDIDMTVSDATPTGPPPSAVGPIATPTPDAVAPSASTAFEMSFDAPYGDALPVGMKLPITNATLSADRTRVTVEFFGSGSYTPGVPCSNNAVPWVAIARDTVLVEIVTVHVPSPTGCIPTIQVAYPMRYDLELPGPFTGTELRDLGGLRTFTIGG